MRERGGDVTWEDGSAPAATATGGATVHCPKKAPLFLRRGASATSWGTAGRALRSPDMLQT
jgi:hypothetical protein